MLSSSVLQFSYSKTPNNRTGGANTEYRGGPGGLGTGLCGPGWFFSLNGQSGLPLPLFFELYIRF